MSEGQSTSRRKFIQSSLGAFGGMSLMGFGGFDANHTNTDFIAFDLHAHPGYFFAKGSDKYPGDSAFQQSIETMLAGKLGGAFFALVADALIISVGANGVKPSRNFSSGEAWVDYKRQITILKELVATQSGALLATKADQFNTDAKAGKIAAYIACEGGDYLEGDAGRLDAMYQDGVRSVQLVHYHPNELGDLQTEPAQHNGLSMAGKLCIKKMNNLGMVIDLAHASYATTKASVDISQHPVMISHTLLDNGSVLPIARRMISREHAKLITSNGGVIGAWPSGLNKDLNDYVDNIKRLIDVVGIDHVGIGTDMDANFKPVLSNYTQLSTLIAHMKTKGFLDSEVMKVLGGNMQRVLSSVLR